MLPKSFSIVLAHINYSSRAALNGSLFDKHSFNKSLNGVFKRLQRHSTFSRARETIRLKHAFNIFFTFNNVERPVQTRDIWFNKVLNAC